MIRKSTVAVPPGPLARTFRSETELAFARDLAGFAGPRIFHGAFLDLAVHSLDEQIAAISRRRIDRDLSTAGHMDCRKVVFHLGFNPQVASSRHRTEVMERQVDFWREMLTEHPLATICLENQWESDWSIFEELFEAVAHPRLGMCLDVAHAHVHSHFDPTAWIEKMRPFIQHLHWTDNHGDRDRHAPLGDGNIDWDAIIDAGAPGETVTLEMNSLPAVRRSLSFLAQKNLRPALPAPVPLVMEPSIP